jgi:serine/threonine protein kinase
VFDPALKCKHRSRDIHDDTVSKLGYTQSAEFEMREYEQIRQFITQIKNYDKYFNMRASVCEPDALGPEDLAGFNDVCHLFTETSIDASNVNANLDKLRAINMPNLGTDLKGWMEQSPLDAHRLRRLNDHISELLVRAVVPMNRLGVMHHDLKSENLMMDRAGANVRIIDWGLAGIATPQAPIPERYFMNNPVTFNRPFSTMLVSDDLRIAPAPEEVAPFVAKLYREYRDLAPIGHTYYTYIFEAMFGLPAEAANRMVNAAVERYNADILRHYTDHGRREFRLHDYFSNVYRYNTDVWGTLTVFYSMFMMPRSHFILPDAVYHDMLRRYRALFTTSVFVNGHLRMNVQHIVGQLRQISEAITKHKAQSRSRFKSNAKPKTMKKMVRFNLGTRRQSNPRRIHMQRVPTPYPLR